MKKRSYRPGDWPAGSPRRQLSLQRFGPVPLGCGLAAQGQHLAFRSPQPLAYLGQLPGPLIRQGLCLRRCRFSPRDALSERGMNGR